MSMISNVPQGFLSMLLLHQCSPVISAHSSHVFIRDATTSMIIGDCLDKSSVKISAIRTAMITRGIHCLSCLIIDYSMSSPDSESSTLAHVASTSFYWYPRAPTRQFYKTFPTHLSRRRVRDWQWPVINSRFELRSTQTTDQASNAIKKYRKDRETEGTSQTTLLNLLHESESTRLVSSRRFQRRNGSRCIVARRETNCLSSLFALSSCA